MLVTQAEAHGRVALAVRLARDRRRLSVPRIRGVAGIWEDEPPGELPLIRLGRSLALPPSQRAVRHAKDEPRPRPGRMFVVGRVLDPHGKPVPGASVMVYGAPKQAGGGPGEDAPAAIGQAACDEMGRYRLDAPRLSSATHFMVGAAAIAPGFGTGWVNLDVDADEPVADITLRSEQVIQGRLFDVQGRPAPGVRVSVEGMGHPQRGPINLPEYIDGPHFWAGNHAKNPDGLARSGDHRRRGPFHHPRHWPGDPRPPHGRRPTVRPATDRGRHRSHGRVEAGDDRPGAGQGHHRPRHVCRHRQARPACDDRDHRLSGQARATATNSRPTPRGGSAPIPYRPTTTPSSSTPPRVSRI